MLTIMTECVNITLPVLVFTCFRRSLDLACTAVLFYPHVKKRRRKKRMTSAASISDFSMTQDLLMTQSAKLAVPRPEFCQFFVIGAE